MSGPYLNEDGDWWVPVEDVPSFRAARETVLAHLDYEVPDDGTLVYRGKVKANLYDAEVGSYDDASKLRFVLAYHFQENPR